MTPQYRSALQLLRERLARPDETVLGDVGFALTTLLEADGKPPFGKKPAAEPPDGKPPPFAKKEPEGEPDEQATDARPPEGQPGEGEPDDAEQANGEPTMLPEARRTALYDLQQKVEAATTTVHAPEVIAALLDALTTFLNEELHEEPEGDRSTMADEVPTPEDENAEDPTDTTAEAAPESGVPAEPPGVPKMMQCEACGHHQEMMPMLASSREAAAPEDGRRPTDPEDPDPDPDPDDPDETQLSATRESGAPKETTMAEPVPVTASAEPAPVAIPAVTAPVPGAPALEPMTESERAELLTLRADARKRQALTKAKKAIKEAGVFMKPDELITFEEAQWPMLIEMAQAPPRSYGTGARPVGPLGSATSMRESAADIFTRALTGGAEA